MLDSSSLVIDKKILSPCLLNTLMIPIQNLKVLKNAKKRCMVPFELMDL